MRHMPALSPCEVGTAGENMQVQFHMKIKMAIARQSGRNMMVFCILNVRIRQGLDISFYPFEIYFSGICLPLEVLDLNLLTKKEHLDCLCDYFCVRRIGKLKNVFLQIYAHKNTCTNTLETYPIIYDPFITISLPKQNKNMVVDQEMEKKNSGK